MRRIAILLFPLSVLLAQSHRISKDARIGYESITANDLSAHLHFIASPELEGRETTLRGQRLAALYIASVFQKLGLKPAGDNGSYLQRFDVEITKVSEQSNITVLSHQTSKSFLFRKDYATILAQDTVLSGPVLFIGFMDTDVDSALAKNRIIVAFAGRRQDSRDTSVPAIRRLTFTRQFAGSIATFVIADDTGAASLQQLTVRFASMLDRQQMRLPGVGGRSRFGFSSPYVISADLAAEILKASGRSVAALRHTAYGDTSFRPIQLSQTTVRIESKLAKELKQTENVLALLEGSDPKLKEEVVVFSGHYDHVGVGGDGVVFPGADDDGSGTVSVLELAEAFVTNPAKPKRSLIFLAVTGEEKGLLGSQYYVTHPFVPLSKTAANLNIDMIGRIDKKYEQLKDSNYVYVIGSDKISTQLDSLLKLSNKESEGFLLDYTYNDDKDPQQFYQRSDHYHFARNGVPIVFFFTGIHDDYHRPSDTVDKILFDRMARIVRLIYTTGWKVANHKSLLAKDVETSIYAR
ncbi:MAG: M28 family peptidase [Ignavibacteria bacterium]|nr:M28 family peptidase [Ignavibacteria bacterium]